MVYWSQSSTLVTLRNFFLSVSFIVSVKVGIFTLNMRDIIIYLARWWEKYLSKRSPLKHTCSWHDKLIIILIDCLAKRGQDWHLKIEPSKPYFILQALFLTRSIISPPPQVNICDGDSLRSPRHSFISWPRLFKI